MPEETWTLHDHIMREQKGFPYATGDFSGLMAAFALASKVIASGICCN